MSAPEPNLGYVSLMDERTGNMLGDFDDTFEALRYARSVMPDCGRDLTILWCAPDHTVTSRANLGEFVDTIEASVQG